MKSIKYFLLTIIVLFQVEAYAQFSEVGNLFEGLIYSSSCWGDYDKDGDIDFVISGRKKDGKAFTSFYNNSKGVFSLDVAGLPQISSGTVSLGDVDADGDLDILICGIGGKSGIYINENAKFTLGFEIESLEWSAVSFCDFDGDGDLDFVTAGKSVKDQLPETNVYKNEKGKFYSSKSDLIGLVYSSIAWGDYDNDGDLDLAISGIDARGASTTQLYENAAGKFIESGFELPGTAGYGNIQWGDYDIDGFIDLLITSSKGTAVYKNNGGSFSKLENDLPSTQKSFGSWIDYDNDGDLDILVQGNKGVGQNSTQLFRNIDGQFVLMKVQLPGLQLGNSTWADFDNDGDYDLLLSGQDDKGVYTTKLFRNGFAINFLKETVYKSGQALTDTLTEQAIGKRPVELWIDIDDDNDLDLVVSTAKQSKIYENNEGKFITGEHRISWYDYDNDGDADLLVTAVKKGEHATIKLFRNDERVFTETRINPKVKDDLLAYWGDFDNDGDYDLVVVKKKGNELMVSSVLENKLAEDVPVFNKNTNPTVPKELLSKVYKNRVLLSWQKSSDEQTSKFGLGYNVYVKSTYAQRYIISPQGKENSVFPELTNLQHNNRMILEDLPPGKYYWSVRAIDGAFAASPFAQIDSFEIRSNFSCVVSSLNDNGPGSLREAINCSNNNFGPDTLLFNLQGEEPFVLRPLSALPKIKNPELVINGLSQDRYKEPIIIDGSQMLDLEPINTNDTIKPTILGIEVRDFEHFPFSFDEELNISFATFKDSALAQNDKNINTTQDNNKAFKRKYVTNGHLGLNYLVLNNENQKRYGISFYYPIGLFFSGFNFDQSPSPAYYYSQSEIDNAVSVLSLRGEAFETPAFNQVQDNFKTYNAGFYVQTFNHLYLMLGLTHLNGAVWKNYTGDISGFGSIYKNPSNNFYAVDYNTVNYNDFLFGLAFVMPYGQVEAGYNRLFRQPFVNVGLNVPIKNMVNVFRF